MTRHEKALALCARFREERLARGLTLAAVGAAAGISKQAISQFEHGGSNPTERIMAAADELGMDIRYIKSGVRHVA